MKYLSGNVNYSSPANIAVLPKTEFVIEKLEDLPRSYNQAKPERLEVLEIIIVKEGEGKLACDINTFSLQSNTVYVIVPGQVRCLQPNPGVTGYLLRIAPGFIHQLHDQFDISFMIQFALKENMPFLIENTNRLTEWETFINKMIKEFTDYGLTRCEIIKGFVKIFLIHLGLEFKLIHRSEMYDKNTELIRNFFSLLWQQTSSKKLVADYADELCVTPNYLNSVIRKLTGSTASHHIQQHIVMEAKRHAIYSVWQMKEIADYLGFEDHAHFSKFFKNYSGINFSSFRKSVPQWNG